MIYVSIPFKCTLDLIISLEIIRWYSVRNFIERNFILFILKKIQKKKRILFLTFVAFIILHVEINIQFIVDLQLHWLRLNDLLMIYFCDSPTIRTVHFYWILF